jgi:hypothetical protein
VDDSSLQLDAGALTAVVRVALGRPAATVESWQAEPLRGLGFGAAIHRVRGAACDGGVRLPWSVIRKQVRGARDSPAGLSYWRREPLANACGLLGELAGVAAPRCLAQGEQAGSVVPWLGDLGDGDGGGWTLERYTLVVRGLGGARRTARAAGRKLGLVRRPARRAHGGDRPGGLPRLPGRAARGRVRFAYCAAAALRLCVAETTWLVRGINPDGTSADVGGLRNPGQRALFESFFGRPFAEVHQQIAATFRFLATCVGARGVRLLPRINVS